MGSRNLTKRDIHELTFPVRLEVTGYAERSVRRTAQGAPFGKIGPILYLMSTAHACRIACASPEARWAAPWPVRIVVRMESSQEWPVRDALRGICGDQGYALDFTGRLGTLDFACVWDAHLLLRHVPRIALAGNRIRPRQ